MNTIWLWLASVLLAASILIATIRKTLGNFSRKGLLEKAPAEDRERFEQYFERLKHYEDCLSFVDHCLRMGMASSLALAFLLPAWPERYSDPAAFRNTAGALCFLALTLAGLLVVGLELLPSLLSRVSPERFMISAFPLIDSIYWIAKIPLKLYDLVLGSLSRLIGSQPAVEPAELLEQEIRSAVEEGEREGVLRESEISMIESIIRFKDLEVPKVMSPRTDMVALDVSTPLSECVRVVIECGHSRLPVFRENRDNIIGILYVKDLLRYWDQKENSGVVLEDILRKANFVPETKKISELFQEFKTQRFHIAIVLDEFGGVAGLITIEDIIEIILGEIEEEQEGEGDENRLFRLNDNLFEVDARLPIQDLNRELDGKLTDKIPEGEGFDTVGGFLFSSMGRIPRVGETFEHGPMRFIVLNADARSIHRVRLEMRLPQAEPGS